MPSLFYWQWFRIALLSLFRSSRDFTSVTMKSNDVLQAPLDLCGETLLKISMLLPFYVLICYLSLTSTYLYHPTSFETSDSYANKRRTTDSKKFRNFPRERFLIPFFTKTSISGHLNSELVFKNAQFTNFTLEILVWINFSTLSHYHKY